MIPVTKPFLPPRELYNSYLDGIWKREWLTNNGPLVNDLELKLKNYLGCPHLLFLGNGTIALQIAIKALGISGEIITTPFSYVATTSSIAWEGCTPVFADIDPETLNISPASIRNVITPKTKAILATHVYGNACDIDAINTIASEHNLKVIYDGAHVFGATYKGRSLFSYGDVTTASFHATKVFHTIEGGAVFTPDPEILRKMVLLRNFGHNGPEIFNGIGINGKNSEFHAAMGLCNLQYIDAILLKRKQQSEYYDSILGTLKAGRIRIQAGCEFNHAYYPVIFETEKDCLKAKESLEKHQISPRRYFYPSLSSLDYVQKSSCPVSESVSPRVLCLPIYHDLSREEQDMIARILLRAQRY